MLENKLIGFEDAVVENTSSQFLLDLNTGLVNSIRRISSKTQVIPTHYLVVQD